jgi:hypothetical protein
MRGKYQLLTPHGSNPEIDVFADKSALVLEWILLTKNSPSHLKIREVAAATGVSVGLTYRVFLALTQKGWLKVSGLRTAKVFKLADPMAILKAWTNHYQLSKKKRLFTYSSAYESKEEIIEVIQKSALKNHVALALHSAAHNFGRGFTNLQGIELYYLKVGMRQKLEKLLKLEPQERGYDVLLIEPYYRAMFQKRKTIQPPSWGQSPRSQLRSAPLLLTYLDLYHFPLRGKEQADHLLKKDLQGRLNG